MTTEHTAVRAVASERSFMMNMLKTRYKKGKRMVVRCSQQGQTCSIGSTREKQQDAGKVTYMSSGQDVVLYRRLTLTGHGAFQA